MRMSRHKFDYKPKRRPRIRWSLVQDMGWYWLLAVFLGILAIFMLWEVIGTRW